MPIKSMTGYGAAVATAGEDTWRIEIRAVNHRHLDLKARLPRELASLEPRLREVISARVARGHLGLAVTPSEGVEVARDVRVDVPFARRVHATLTELRDVLGLNDPVRLEHVLAYEGVVATTTRDVDAKAAWAALSAGIGAALDDLDTMRSSEGARLERDLLARLDAVARLTVEIRAALPDILAGARARIQERIRTLAEGLEPEWREDRLEAEIAMLADRCDVAEELTRLDAHLAAVRELITGASAEPCGRKLEFLSIELNRELNTIGSKSSSSAVSRLVVDAKAEVERIREQVANVE